MEGWLALCLCVDLFLYWGGWWIAENVLDASFCFVFGTLAVNQRGNASEQRTGGEAWGSFLHFGAFSSGDKCNRSDIYMCFWVRRTRLSERDRRNEKEQHRLWQKDFQDISLFLLFFVFVFFKQHLWDVSHSDSSGQVVLLSVSGRVLCQRVIQLAEMKSQYWFISLGVFLFLNKKMLMLWGLKLSWLCSKPVDAWHPRVSLWGLSGFLPLRWKVTIMLN